MFFVLLLALLFTRSRSGFLAFVISYIAYWILLLRTYSYAKIKSALIRYSIFLFAILLIFGTPYTPSFFSIIRTGTQENRNTGIPISGTVLETGGTESGDIRKIVWTGAVETIWQKPILGSGPETFAYTYYQSRPVAHNLTSEWDYLYNKAHNEYLNVASGAGLIGLGAYLYLHYALAKMSLTKIVKSKKMNQDDEDQVRHIYPVLGATITSFAITSFFGFSVIPVYFTLILLAIISSTLPGDKLENSSTKFPSYLYFIFPILLIYPSRMFMADRAYTIGKQYLDSGKAEIASPLFQNAINYRNGLDIFHGSLAESYALEGKKEQALHEAEVNRQLNPVNLNSYRSRAKTYLTLASKEPSYYLESAKEIKQARMLAPTDPKLAYNLGLIYTRTNQLAQAEQELKEAITLKPNYAEPYYALTLLYEQTKQTNKIPNLLNSAKTNLATYSAQLKEKIEKHAN